MHLEVQQYQLLCELSEYREKNIDLKMQNNKQAYQLKLLTFFITDPSSVMFSIALRSFSNGVLNLSESVSSTSALKWETRASLSNNSWPGSSSASFMLDKLTVKLAPAPVTSLKNQRSA